MAEIFNLINEAWIPIIRQSGKKEKIAPWQITETNDPVIKLAAVRPDFNGALAQFLIGLVQTTMPPKNESEWENLFEKLPTTDNLKHAFKSVEKAFNLNGDGPKFMQDFEDITGEQTTISSLLIDEPGDQTLRENKDHFTKRNHYTRFCLKCAATALFTLQTNAPSGGAGHRTSLRGGGPLVTLWESVTLWKTIWSNCILVTKFNNFPGNYISSDELIFPWLGKTRTSANKEEIKPTNVNPLQMFWGMPRRIRLTFEESPCVCDLCKKDTKAYVKTYRTQNFGTNYKGAWKHPLTPYRKNSETEYSAFHAGDEGISYRHWLGFVITGNTNPKKPVEIAYNVHQLRNTDLFMEKTNRLWIFGYNMDKMKAVSYVESIMPIISIKNDYREALEYDIAKLITAADAIAKNLCSCLKQAWFSPKTKAKPLFETVRSTFWQNTEKQFYDALGNIKNANMTASDKIPLLKDWHTFLHSESIKIFDTNTTSFDLDGVNPKRIAIARKNLTFYNHSKKILQDILNFPKTEKPAKKKQKKGGEKNP